MWALVTFYFIFLTYKKNRKNVRMNLLQLFIPLTDNQGHQFDQSIFLDLRQQLTDRFGGVTIYSRGPVTGLWKEAENQIIADQMIIYEVLTEQIDLPYWKQFKLHLEDLLQQEQILIRYFAVSTI
jgi:hypothetical protein